MNPSTAVDAATQAREQHFRAVFDATYVDLLRFVRRRADPSHAEDVVADTFLVAWRRIEDLPRRIEDARPWLFGIARHSLLNARRGQERSRALAVRIGQTSPEPDLDTGADLVARRVDLAAAWPRLTAAEQEVIALAVWDGLSSSQAAAALDITATAYRLRLSRARRVLRRHLSGDSS